MGKALDLKNCKFGKLTVLEKTNKRSSNGSVLWLCQCECGNICEVIGSALKNGHTTSCGCYANSEEIKLKRRKKIKDISNQRFGSLIAKYSLLEQKNNHTVWHCICDCGNECDIPVSQLTSNHTRSCGCLKNKQNPLIDIQNQRFGKLVALEPTADRINGAVIWKCKCDCGNICFVSRPHLINFYTSSCGCLKISKGEIKIIQILQDLGLPFETQKTFDTCRFTDTKALAYFDFYVNNKFIIEYDGEQHFISKDYFGGQEEFQNRKKKDEFKNKWCEQNGIPIIRISYQDYEKLNKNYLIERIEKYV